MGFHRAESALLLCTDVAARGLDFPAVTHILQFDPPGEAAEYVQRVGRTARMGKRGARLGGVDARSGAPDTKRGGEQGPPRLAAQWQSLAR